MEDHPVIGERILANVDDYATLRRSCDTTMNGWMAKAIPTA